jgi:hypothetical protein
MANVKKNNWTVFIARRSTGVEKQDWKSFQSLPVIHIGWTIKLVGWGPIKNFFNNRWKKGTSTQGPFEDMLDSFHLPNKLACSNFFWALLGTKVGVLRASHKIFLSLTGKFEWKFSRFHLCTAQTFHANSLVRLKKSLWDSRTTATLEATFYLVKKIGFNFFSIFFAEIPTFDPRNGL